MLSHRNTEYVKEYIKMIAETVFDYAKEITVTFTEGKYYVDVITQDGRMEIYSVIDDIPGINNSNINFVDVIKKVKERREREGW